MHLPPASARASPPDTPGYPALLRECTEMATRIKPRKRSKAPLGLAFVFLALLGGTGFIAYRAWESRQPKPTEPKPAPVAKDTKPAGPRVVYVDEKGNRLPGPPPEQTQANADTDNASAAASPVANATEGQPTGAAFGVYGVRSKDRDKDAEAQPTESVADTSTPKANPPAPTQQPPATQPGKDKPVVTFFGVEGR